MRHQQTDTCGEGGREGKHHQDSALAKNTHNLRPAVRSLYEHADRKDETEANPEGLKMSQRCWRPPQPPHPRICSHFLDKTHVLAQYFIV